MMRVSHKDTCNNEKIDSLTLVVSLSPRAKRALQGKPHILHPRQHESNPDQLQQRHLQLQTILSLEAMTCTASSEPVSFNHLVKDILDHVQNILVSSF